MREIFNRTLLYENGTVASSITLSEPITNFEFWGIQYINWPICYFPGKHISYPKLDIISFNQGAAYMHAPKLFTMSNDNKTLTCTKYQFLIQSATSSPYLFGSTSNNNNLKTFNRVWGFNRISGTPSTAQGVIPSGTGWKIHNEILLASGNVVDGSWKERPRYFTLSQPASSFERLRIQVGAYGESTNLYEYGTPSADNQTFGVHANWGNSTGSNMITMARYIWLDGTKTLSAVNGGQGKAYQLAWNAAKPYTATGTYITGTTADSNTYLTRPIQTIWGINKKV